MSGNENVSGTRHGDGGQGRGTGHEAGPGEHDWERENGHDGRDPYRTHEQGWDQPHGGGWAPEPDPMTGGHGVPHQAQGQGQAQGGWGWQPVPQGGEYDSDATAFVALTPEMLDAAGLGEPLAAPGHGYTPPTIAPPVVPVTSVGSGGTTDPTATGTFTLPTGWADQAGGLDPSLVAGLGGPGVGGPGVGAPEQAAPAPAVPRAPIPALIPLPPLDEDEPVGQAAVAPAPPRETHAPAPADWPQPHEVRHDARHEVPDDAGEGPGTAEWHFPEAHEPWNAPQAPAHAPGPEGHPGAPAGDWNEPHPYPAPAAEFDGVRAYAPAAPHEGPGSTLGDGERLAPAGHGPEPSDPHARAPQEGPGSTLGDGGRLAPAGHGPDPLGGSGGSLGGHGLPYRPEFDVPDHDPSATRAAETPAGPPPGANRGRVLGGPGVGVPEGAAPEAPGAPVRESREEHVNEATQRLGIITLPIPGAAPAPAREPAPRPEAGPGPDAAAGHPHPGALAPGDTFGHGLTLLPDPAPEPAEAPEATEAALEPAAEPTPAHEHEPAREHEHAHEAAFAPEPATESAAATAPDAETAPERAPDAETAPEPAVRLTVVPPVPEDLPALAPAEEPAYAPETPAAASWEPHDLHEPHEAPGPREHLEHPTASYVLRVNGADRPVTGAWIGESLLYVLRERLGLAGAKDGCSQGECGACAVQVDGRLVNSCLVPAATTAGSEVRTVEGLAADGELSDVQRALCRSDAVQCGFCVPGMAMTIHDLLEGNHAPGDLETRQALCGNLCRCSGYSGALNAVREVVAERAETARAADAAADEARIPHQAPPGEGGVHPQPGQPFPPHDGGIA
ncbi:2Fe-2S iron-sulfur cluster-binding protein [Streptomyces sp. BI20]|uniref:(2Fe-2S)-binding protein n=1 Tax=Streptomyces sp. BI20 TaxID=3403460 RepID=UPI003C7290E2